MIYSSIQLTSSAQAHPLEKILPCITLNSMKRPCQRRCGMGREKITISLLAFIKLNLDALTTSIQTAQCLVTLPSWSGMIRQSLDVLKLRLEIQVSTLLFADITPQETSTTPTSSTCTAQITGMATFQNDLKVSQRVFKLKLDITIQSYLR